jgi:predicted nicotinamide N-methyase
MELVEDTVHAGPLVLRIVRPPDADALIDEARFDNDEFMPYWAELWKSGVHLAAAVAERDLRGRTVVELGCGLGLPSIAAALSGGEVLATDWATDALEVTRRNAERNGVRVETLLADWEEPGVLVARAPFDLVLCSDVLYEERNVDALLALLPRLGDEVLLGEPGRATAARFFEAADREWEIGREGQVTRLARLPAPRS